MMLNKLYVHKLILKHIVTKLFSGVPSYIYETLKDSFNVKNDFVKMCRKLFIVHFIK